MLKKDIVKSTLLHILGVQDNEKIYARNCEIKEIEPSVAREFCNNNHLQNYVNASIKLGAYHKDNLVAVMTFSRPNISRNITDNNSYELSRFCSINNTTVVGIASKLLHYFVSRHEFDRIISYSDRRWFDGNLYKKLGFDFIHHSPPSYWYVKNNGYRRYHRFTFRKGVLKSLDNYNSSKTEYEIMSEQGYRRIWDCGNSKWVLTND